MRVLFTAIFILLVLRSHSQTDSSAVPIDTLLPFFGIKPLHLTGYQNRSVPYNSINPLYVLITYPGGKSKQYEYFRIDSSNYLLYEFFRSDKGSSNDGLKSEGKLTVINRIVDSSISTGVNGVTGNRRTFQAYFKGFSKEGKWDEYEDSFFFHRYWTGNYLNNKKVGVWSNYIYDPNGDRLIQQIDYDKDSTVKIFTTNIVGLLSTDSLRYYLIGRWPVGCEEDNEVRIPMMKCQLYEGQFGDDCNSRFGRISYYGFFKNGSFRRQNGETCKKVKNYATTGTWKLTKVKGKLSLEIILTNKSDIKYHILYLDREGNMVVDRQ
jgi:hypothetical protein